MADSKTGAQATVSQLVAEGVEVILGIPGGHNLWLCDAVLDYPELRFICGRHEQDITFMADGYARASGKIAVPMVISGAGVGNSVAALADALVDSVPLVLIASCPDPSLIGRGAFHELRDQTGVLAAVTKWNIRVESVEQIPQAVNRAFWEAYSGRPGPTAVEIPVPIQSQEGRVEILAPRRPQPKPADIEAVRQAARLLSKAKSPIAYFGTGAACSDCSPAAIELVERLGAPCFATALGQGVIPYDHPLYLPWSWVENGPARPFLEEADTVIVVGSSLDQADTASWTLPLPKNLIHIDTCSEIIGRNYPAKVSLVGDAKTVLAQLLEELEPLLKPGRSSPAAQIAEIKEKTLSTVRDGPEWQFVDAMRQAIPKDAFVVNDAAAVNAWVMAYLPRYLPRTESITRSAAALGYAFPSALGAKLAYADRQAVAVAGDGGFLFTSNALATGVQYRLNAVAVVFNDNSYSTIKYLQDNGFGRHIGVDLHNPDFPKLAEAFGAVGVRAEHPEQLYEGLKAAWQRDVPTVIEVPLEVKASLFQP